VLFNIFESEGSVVSFPPFKEINLTYTKTWQYYKNKNDSITICGST